MNYEMRTLQQGDRRISYSEALCFDWRVEEQTEDNARATREDARGETKGTCKECGNQIKLGDYWCFNCNFLRNGKKRINERVCKKCSKTKHIDEFKTNRQQSFKIAPHVCGQCKDESTKRNIIQASRRREKDPKHKVRKSLSRTLRGVMRTIKNSKSTRLSSLLGCSPKMFREHLQSKFDKKMTWDNYGTYWHVDHILPKSSFDHNDQEEVKKCWHFSNLRPLEAQANMDKSNKIIDCQPELIMNFH